MVQSLFYICVSGLTHSKKIKFSYYRCLLLNILYSHKSPYYNLKNVRIFCIAFLNRKQNGSNGILFTIYTIIRLSPRIVNNFAKPDKVKFEAI